MPKQKDERHECEPGDQRNTEPDYHRFELKPRGKCRPRRYDEHIAHGQKDLIVLVMMVMGVVLTMMMVIGMVVTMIIMIVMVNALGRSAAARIFVEQQ